MLPLLGEPAPQLPGRCRLAGALQPQQQDDARPLRGGRQAPGRLPEEREHLVANDAHHLLRRGQAFQDLLVDSPVAHPVDERLDDLEVDVRFQQRHADLAQGDLDRLLGQASLSPKRAEHLLKTIAE